MAQYILRACLIIIIIIIIIITVLLVICVICQYQWSNERVAFSQQMTCEENNPKTNTGERLIVFDNNKLRINLLSRFDHATFYLSKYIDWCPSEHQHREVNFLKPITFLQ